MDLNKKIIQEERVFKEYNVDGKAFTPEIIYRDGEFHHFTLHIQNGFKIKYDLELDKEDKNVFDILKDFFKKLD